ncbi:acyloxyacyl hydrolase [Polaribacter uvawellassae]|uniref:acyloxyacyl hydrolase n=1 Tax=Polaribacter uvawellassae TaxID=3133495 RepID=UPI00321B9D5F
MKQKLFIFLIFVCLIAKSYGQKSTKSFFTITKYGIQVSQGNENNFLFDDADYFYRTNTLKGQLYFPITKLKTIEISLVVQPQIQFVKHQLYNEQFVRPEEDNYLEKRQRFTQLKNLTITAIEFSLEAKQQLYKNLSVFLQASLGFSFIDTETERLAKGFTFIENGNLGLDYQFNEKISIQFFGGVGHVSNFNFQMPNSGYNIFNIGIGFSFLNH